MFEPVVAITLTIDDDKLFIDVIIDDDNKLILADTEDDTLVTVDATDDDIDVMFSPPLWREPVTTRLWTFICK